ncbi:hypothetical protein GGR53DRAFT_295001 [Hypoxylon sp. FL1150]|nr:hypothetical protein GGR53DRAFT_295001 [Hypoxylon sp. FL1150]
MMLRSTRSLLASSSRAIASQRASVSSPQRLQLREIATATKSIPITSKASTLRMVSSVQTSKYATKAPSGIQYGRDPEGEKKLGQQKLESNPEVVTTESSVRHLYEPDGQGKQKPIKHGVKDDLETVKDTFDLSDVPKEPYILGLAGTLPYLATSLCTVYLSWDLNTEWPSSSNFVNHFLITHDTARHLLNVIEPIQLGYGAVIISFLGAIHWGMEYVDKVPNPARTKFRYGLGVLASVVAWPTLFMPVDFALTTQFGAFIMLYFADARATVRAWAPSWYGTYRFALTAIVGAAIFISLIGRMKVGDAKPRLTGLNEKLHSRQGEEDYTKKWQNLEEEEKEKVRKEKEEEEKRKKKEEEEKAKEEAKKEKGKGKSKDKGKGKDKGEDAKGKDSGKEQSEGKDEQKEDNEETSSEDKGEENEGKDDEKKDGEDQSNDEKEDEKGNTEKGDKDGEEKSDKEGGEKDSKGKGD